MVKTDNIALRGPVLASVGDGLKPSPVASARAGQRGKAPHAVIIIENMTVPPDRRVWQQVQALKSEGWRVSVISPQLGSYMSPRETIDGVEIYRHPLPFEARGLAGYFLEYGAALFWESVLLSRINPRDIDVVQICNPPDFLFLPALIAKKLGQAKIVFDHHDLTPELLVQKTGKNSGLLLGLARWAEKKTFAVADKVISTNASFKQIAVEKGEKDQHDVSVVYSAPDLSKLPVVPVNPDLKRGKEILLLWVGVINSQDGVDLLLEAVAALRFMPGGESFHLLIAGDGAELKAMKKYARKLKIDDVVEFAGFLSGDKLAEAFTSADIGIGSDPKNPFNDRLAMNKVMEYMAYSLPIAMFELDECRKIAGSSAFYAGGNSPDALAAKISNLIEAPTIRANMGAKGHVRLVQHYGWAAQAERYLDVYRQILAER